MPRNSRPPGIFSEMFSWLPPETPLRQNAVFPSHPKDRHAIAGDAILSIDVLVAEIGAKGVACGVALSAAISENYPLLRVSQISHCGYNGAL